MTFKVRRISSFFDTIVIESRALLITRDEFFCATVVLRSRRLVFGRLVVKSPRSSYTFTFSYTSRGVRRMSNGDLHGWVVRISGRNPSVTARLSSSYTRVRPSRNGRTTFGDVWTVRNVWSICPGKSTVDFHGDVSFFRARKRITLWTVNDGGGGYGARRLVRRENHSRTGISTCRDGFVDGDWLLVTPRHESRWCQRLKNEFPAAAYLYFPDVPRAIVRVYDVHGVKTKNRSLFLPGPEQKGRVKLFPPNRPGKIGKITRSITVPSRRNGLDGRRFHSPGRREDM